MSTATENGFAPDELDYDDLPSSHAFMLPGSAYAPDGDWEIDLAPTPCPDAAWKPGDQIDARLWAGSFERRGARMRLRDSRRLSFNSKQAIDDYCASVLRDVDMRESQRLREAWEGGADGFAFGQEAIPSLLGSSSLTRQYLPLIPGPVTRQLYWQSYFEMSAKAFEAYNHNPIAWRAIQLIEQFSIGKGVRSKVTKSTGSGKGQRHDAAQKVFDDFWERNRMDDRLKKIARDIEIMGEQFIRYFPEPGNSRGVVIRSLDPASIYDIITDPEDHETVFAYHQQFQTPYQLFAPQGTRPMGAQAAPTGPTQSGAVTRYIIRQVDWREIDHYKLNVGASERRGRSSLYPVLGWLKRLTDYMTSRVIQADMQSRYVWDLLVKGSPSDVAKIRAALFPGNRPPAPGSVLGHTQNAELTATGFQQGASGLASDPVFEALALMASLGIGVPKEWLGITGRATRANALVATEPGARRMEANREILRTILENIGKRVFERARIYDAEIEFTFPSIASEDRKDKLDDLGTAEANGWVSKQTAATIAAKELDIENYDFDEEQKLIAAEFPEPELEDVPDSEPDPLTGKKPQRPKQGDGTVRRQVIVASKRQAAKLDITKSPSAEDEPPGLLVPTNGEAPETGGNGGPPTRGGLPASQNPIGARGASTIRSQMRTREARAQRRRPDDPDFLQAGQEFRERSARNLGDLVRAASR